MLTFCASKKKKKKDPLLHPPFLSKSAQTPLVAAVSLNLISGTMCERFAKFEPQTESQLEEGERAAQRQGTS